MMMILLGPLMSLQLRGGRHVQAFEEDALLLAERHNGSAADQGFCQGDEQTALMMRQQYVAVAVCQFKIGLAR